MCISLTVNRTRKTVDIFFIENLTSCEISPDRFSLRNNRRRDIDENVITNSKRNWWILVIFFFLPRNKFGIPRFPGSLIVWWIFTIQNCMYTARFHMYMHKMRRSKCNVVWALELVYIRLLWEEEIFDCQYLVFYFIFLSYETLITLVFCIFIW